MIKSLPNSRHSSKTLEHESQGAEDRLDPAGSPQLNEGVSPLMLGLAFLQRLTDTLANLDGQPTERT